jgi:chromosome segregation ATPase
MPKRAREHDKREVEKEDADLNREGEKIRRDGREKQDEKKGLQNKLDSLASKQGQLLSQLQAFNRDAAKGWEWLQEHQDEFEKPVFGPAVVTCSVKDPRYSDLVQSLMGGSDFFCFTTQTRNDHKKLSAVFYDELEISVTIRSCFQPLSQFRKPLSQQELAERGFDGYAIDFLEGPEPVLAMLCSDSKLHTAGVALRPLADDKMDIVIRDVNVSKFSCGNSNYRVRRRLEYGPDACTTAISQIRPARYWKGDVVDPTEKLELQKQIDQVTEELAAIGARYKELKSQHERLDEKDKAFTEEIVCAGPLAREAI